MNKRITKEKTQFHLRTVETARGRLETVADFK